MILNYAVFSAWVVTESDMMVVSGKKKYNHVCVVSITFSFVSAVNHHLPFKTEYLEISLSYKRVYSGGVPTLCTSQAVPFAQSNHTIEGMYTRVEK